MHCERLMDNFSWRNTENLHAEQLPLSTLIAATGTPTYVYSKSALIEHFQAFMQAFAPRNPMICFAVKSNSSLAVLQSLAQLQSGFDIVSGGELARVLKAGGDPKRVVFSGIGKTADEMAFALQQGIYCFNIESEPELALLTQIATHLNLKAPVALRINPNVDPQSHPYISTGLKTHKFGIPIEDAAAMYAQMAQNPVLSVQGIACHIGSQITELSPFETAFKALSSLISQLKSLGISLKHVNVGGGLGVHYHDKVPPTIHEYAAVVSRHFSQDDMALLLEPGRSIAAMAGILVTQVLYLKSVGDKRFCIVDAGMNDLIRPALYGAYQDIIPTRMRSAAPQEYDVVGPVCETGDSLGKDRQLSIEPGDHLAILGAGAYGFTMSSQYNSRPRAAEVMVYQDKFKVIRPRETIEDLLAKECHFS